MVLQEAIEGLASTFMQGMDIPERLIPTVNPHEQAIVCIARRQQDWPRADYLIQQSLKLKALFFRVHFVVTISITISRYARPPNPHGTGGV